MRNLLENLKRECQIKSTTAKHDRVREEYRQILRHIDVLIDEYNFAVRLEKVMLSENVQFVVIDGDTYRPISAVEAISKIEQVDIKQLFRR